jgi:hypothetical protein
MQRRGAGESGDTWRENKGERGGPDMAANGSGGRHRSPAGWHGRRRCRAAVSGGGTWVTWACATDRRDRVTVGLSGQRRGAGRARQCDAVLTRGPGSTVLAV